MSDNTAIVIMVVAGMLALLIGAIFIPNREQSNTGQIWRMKDPDRPYKGYFDPSRNLFVTCSGTFLDMTEEQLEKEYGSCK